MLTTHKNFGNILCYKLFPLFPRRTFAAPMNEQELIEKASQVFMRLGIKSITMDDMARQLGVSKKTIYKYVKDKNELVERTLALHGQHEHGQIEEICEKGYNAIDEIFEISKFVSEMLSNVHPSVHFDLEKYYPEAWAKTMRERQQYVFECVNGNLEKGGKDGLYRSNLNPEIIARIYIAKLDVLFDGEIFPAQKFNFAEVYLEFFRYHIRGIASEKGLNYLIEKVQKERSNQ